jgi:hypothetical protein
MHDDDVDEPSAAAVDEGDGVLGEEEEEDEDSFMLFSI